MRRKQEELSFTAEEAGLSTQRNPPRLPEVCMAITCLGPEWASPLSAHAARATPGHCSPQADLPALPWSSAQPPAHRYRARQMGSASPGLPGRGTEGRGELPGGCCRERGGRVRARPRHHHPQRTLMRPWPRAVLCKQGWSRQPRKSPGPC